MTPKSRRYLIGALRWLSALASLLAVLLLFRVPLAHSVTPGLDRLLAGTGADVVLGLGPAPGFNLQARSEPDGAVLRVDGKVKGIMPLVGNVVCRAGQGVELEAFLNGHEPWRRVVECREGGQMDLIVRLERSP